MANKKSLNDTHMADQKVYPWVPFGVLNTVWRKIPENTKFILDAGCGKGQPMKFINRHHGYFAVGLDIYEPYLKQCDRQKIHDEYVRGNITALPFKDRSFDVVLCLEVLEHLERRDGEKLLKELERVARKQVILSTPAGKYQQKTYDGNLYQEHKHIWSLDEMKQLGYKVTGVGMRNLGGKAGIQSPLPGPVKWLINIAWMLAGPIVYFFPRLAGDMVCVKKI
jgi:SAM-dependent methyltransferase